MCTLILAWRVFDGTPVAVGANRDEALDRPSRPPAVLDENPTVVAPQDAEAGGTWLGYNDAGLVVGVTNRSADVEGERSRGLLVRDALARGSTADAVAYVRQELAEREYAGFNLVVADADEAELLEWDGVLRTTHYDPGVYVVVNDLPGSRTGDSSVVESDPRDARVRDAVRPGPDDTVEEWFERAERVLRDHDLGTCVHDDGYGTRSSSLVRIDDDGGAEYRFADGKPCETDYERVDAANNHV